MQQLQGFGYVARATIWDLFRGGLEVNLETVGRRTGPVSQDLFTPEWKEGTTGSLAPLFPPLQG